MKYLSSELIEKTGAENALESIGSMSVSIGGIAVNEASHVIDTGVSESVLIIIGTEEFAVILDEDHESDMSDGLRALRAVQVAEIEASEAVEVAE